MQSFKSISRQPRVLVFDSGVGGLSVVAEIRKRLPGLSLDYVADDAFRPYGEKSAHALIERLPELLSVLDIMLQPDCIVIACNTASTTALSAIRDHVSTPVIGVVPAIKPAAELSRTGKIGVLGTPGTVKRDYVDGLIHQFAGECDVLLQGSVKLVEFAERKLAGEGISLDAIKQEIAPLFTDEKNINVDVVVLACTHFPLLREEFQAVSEENVQWIDSGEAIARRVDTVLSTLTPAPSQKRPDTAFLIGPNAEANRVEAFQAFGFDKVVGLMP